MSLGSIWIISCALWALLLSPIPLSSKLLQGKDFLVDWRDPLAWLAWLFAWLSISTLWSNEIPNHSLALLWTMWAMLWAMRWVPPSHTVMVRWTAWSAALGLAGALIHGGWYAWHGEILEARDWTPWVSHIRLSLLGALAAGWTASQPKARSHPRKAWWTLMALWGTFTAVTGSMTSALLWPLVVFWAILQRWNQPITQRLAWGGLAAVALAATGGMFLWLSPVALPEKPWKEFTPWGNRYTHQPARVLSEGGHRVFMYACEQEWDSAWSQVSERPLDEGVSSLRPVLLRYLTSLGVPKDGASILALTPEQVADIENRQTNARFLSGLQGRGREIRFELEMWKDGGNPSGHSLTQRLEFWRAGWWAGKSGGIWGHGFGDVRSSMASAYQSLNSKLRPEYRHGTHNQWLQWWVGGGWIALGLACGFLLASLKWLRSLPLDRRKLGEWGLLVLSLSFLFEDTLHTQAGIAVGTLALMFMVGSKQTD
ncbi:MAG: O-antigen ligase family protein [Bacteroidetes bacterium]|nr:O-antigen ligase family protein [Bacteroidota bacterium]